MVYTIAAVGTVLLSIVYLIDNRLHLWPRGMFSSTVEYHPTELEAREAIDNLSSRSEGDHTK